VCEVAVLRWVEREVVELPLVGLWFGDGVGVAAAQALVALARNGPELLVVVVAGELDEVLFAACLRAASTRPAGTRRHRATATGARRRPGIATPRGSSCAVYKTDADREARVKEVAVLCDITLEEARERLGRVADEEHVGSTASGP
jgi:hypothetical protein